MIDCLNRDIRKNPRSMYARVPQSMAQFVLKMEKLSHIMGTAPIVELARAYGLHPRLWLLVLDERSFSDGGNLCPLWLVILSQVSFI